MWSLDVIHKLNFERWKQSVDDTLEVIAGVTADDLPDIDFYDRYVNDATPKQVARELLRENGYPLSL
jgi:hypothetical protein